MSRLSWVVILGKRRGQTRPDEAGLECFRSGLIEVRAMGRPKKRTRIVVVEVFVKETNAAPSELAKDRIQS